RVCSPVVSLSLCFFTVCYLSSMTATATPEIYTLSLHDALPIYAGGDGRICGGAGVLRVVVDWVGQVLLDAGIADSAKQRGDLDLDRKSTRLNSSHGSISYAVFCLKKKKASLTNTAD